VSAIDALRSLGETLNARKKATEEEERQARIAAQRAELERTFDLADRMARTLMGAAAPARSSWRDFGAGMALAPIGGPIEGYDPWDGADGELILRRFPDALWYRPRLRDDSARIRDLEHLARMIAARSIYA
jgi:hypothetical protein